MPNIVERRRKVQAELEGDLLGLTEELERRTGLKVSDLIRQGLVRLAREIEAEGRISVHPLPEAAGA